MDYSPWSERENWPFLKVAISPKTTEAMPTKIGVYACYINTYFFEPILIIFLTMGYSPWSEREKFQYLRNHRGYAHQNWCVCMLHQYLFARFFRADSKTIKYLGDHIVHGQKGKISRF